MEPFVVISMPLPVAKVYAFVVHSVFLSVCLSVCLLELLCDTIYVHCKDFNKTYHKCLSGEWEEMKRFSVSRSKFRLPTPAVAFKSLSFFNRLKPSAVKWLHFKVFRAILV